MQIDKIKSLLISILAELGIYIDAGSSDMEDIDLTEYISDSLDFIAFFIAIEDTFNIELPDELLGLENIRSLNAFSHKVTNYIQESNLSSTILNKIDSNG